MTRIGKDDPRDDLTVVSVAKRQWEKTFDAISDPLMIVDGRGTVKPAGFNNMAADGYIDVAEENALGLEVGFYTPVPGATGETSVTYRPYVLSTDWFNPAPFNYSQTPNERPRSARARPRRVPRGRGRP